MVQARAGEREQFVARHPGACAVQTRQLQLLPTSLALNLLLASAVEGVLEALGPFPFPHTSLEGALRKRTLEGGRGMCRMRLGQEVLRTLEVRDQNRQARIGCLPRPKDCRPLLGAHREEAERFLLSQRVLRFSLAVTMSSTQGSSGGAENAGGEGERFGPRAMCLRGNPTTARRLVAAPRRQQPFRFDPHESDRLGDFIQLNDVR